MHPTPPGDSWRAWLLTGNRGKAADRRRVRGAHRGLKRILADGENDTGDRPRPWKDFSSAMVRQSVDEALNELPPDHRQVVKLAYIGGLSNREIAQRLGLSVGGVQRRLRQALARISEQVEHGRNASRRAVFGLLAWLSANRLVQALHRAPVIGGNHLVRTAIVLAVAAAAGSALAVHQALPGGPAVGRPHASASASAAPITVTVPHSSAAPVAPNLPTVVPGLPVSVPPLPSLPALPTPSLP
jgi:RNA polymerase sigma factor (sigma-70 family)